MIYVTGDTHADFHRFSLDIFPEQRDMTKDDYVIICGDFGGIWDRGSESKEEVYWLKWLEEKPFTLLFIDGNHENFDRLNSYPQKEWHGGKVHEIRPHVLHLMRGQVFELAGKKIFTFGGASSHDISGGLLDPDDPDLKKKRRELDREYEPYRIKHITWWEQEMPTEEEMQEGLENLRKNKNKVDFILTHCCATSTQEELGIGSIYKADRATEYLEQIKKTVSCKMWFFGHYHENMNVNAREKLLYEQIIRIS